MSVDFDELDFEDLPPTGQPITAPSPSEVPGAVAGLTLGRNPGMRLISDDTLSTTSVVYVDGAHIAAASGPGLATALYPKLRGWMGV